jgi:hypothetical protein
MLLICLGKKNFFCSGTIRNRLHMNYTEIPLYAHQIIINATMEASVFFYAVCIYHYTKIVQNGTKANFVLAFFVLSYCFKFALLRIKYPRDCEQNDIELILEKFH